MVEIRVKALTREAAEIAGRMGFTAIQEYRTADGTRIDLAILNGGQKLLAIEFENSYKWIRQRLLYNIVKASRAGFSELWVVYPFQTPPLGWIKEYALELGVELRVLEPEEFREKIKGIKAR
ncbi:WYL domain-containing protein [Thermococcus barossii]|nr:WYL domain-containing protein [Thermococcus barossii]